MKFGRPGEAGLDSGVAENVRRNGLTILKKQGRLAQVVSLEAFG